MGRLQVVEKDLKMILDARKEVESQATGMLEQGMDSQVCCGRFFSLLLRSERSSSSYSLYTNILDSTTMPRALATIMLWTLDFLMTRPLRILSRTKETIRDLLFWKWYSWEA